MPLLSPTSPRFILGVAFVALTLSANSPKVCACSCIPNPLPKEALAKSDAVFVGEVKAVTKRGSIEDGDVRIDLQVSSVWKGEIPRTLSISTDRSICGYPFEPASKYLIYARRFPDQTLLSTNVCTRTAMLSDAKEDLAALGSGLPPRRDPLSPHLSWMRDWSVGLAVVVLVYLSFRQWQRKRVLT
jgi:hypothetical protein